MATDQQTVDQIRARAEWLAGMVGGPRRGRQVGADALALLAENERLQRERNEFRDSALFYAARVAELNDKIAALRTAQRDPSLTLWLIGEISRWVKTAEQPVDLAETIVDGLVHRCAAHAEGIAE